MNFLQETRVFSILSIVLMATILLGTFIFLNLIFSSFEDYYTNLIFERHKELLKSIKNEKIENGFLSGEPTLLGYGFIKYDEEIFYPDYIRLYWNVGKKNIKNINLFQATKPIKTNDLYFQMVLSPYQDKTFITIYESTMIGYLEEKIKLLSILVFSTALVLPLYLYLFLKRAGKLYFAMLKEAKENPLIKLTGEEPETIINVLRKTNEELKKRYDELEVLSNTLSKNIPSGIIILNEKNKVIKVNDHTNKILQISNLVEGCGLEEILKNHKEIFDFLNDCLNEKKPVMRKKIKENEKIFEFTFLPLLKESSLLGTLILFQDLTEIIKLEENLKEKENLANIGTFAAGIAHEFRNSLATIIGYGKLLQKSEIKTEDQKYLKELLAEAKHINDVITSFLEFTKIQKLQKEETKFLKIIKVVIEPLKINYPKINFITGEKDIKLYIDPYLFAQALRAVIENSCEAQKEGDIFIDCQESENKIIIEIKDSGEGMDEETAKNAFIPFFSTKPNGTGLGLPLAHKILTLHNGSISIYSKKGVGTNIKILLNKEVLQNDTHN